MLKRHLSKNSKLKNKLLFGILFSSFFGFSVNTFALPYNPSDTLDPTCAPGDLNCYVVVIPGQTGNAGEIMTTDGSNVLWSSSITGGLTMSGDLAVNGGDITSTGTLTINSASTNSLTIDSGTTGDINIGTGGNAKSINMGNSTVATTLSFDSGVTTEDAFVITTSSLTSGTALKIVGPSSNEILNVEYDSIDPWDGSRLSIGTSGKFDQLYVDGRINYSWNMIFEDFISYRGALTTTDGQFGEFYYDTQGADTCQVRHSVAVGATQTSSGTVLFNCNTSSATNAWLGTNGFAITSTSLLPVLETRLQATSNTDHRFIIGFLDLASDSNTLGISDTNSSANEIMFRKAAGETYWEGVTRSASGVEVVTEFTSYSTSVIRKLRIEAETGRVRFYIDDTLVGTHTSGVPSTTLGLGFYAGNAVSAASSRSTILDYIRIWSDDPMPGQFSEEEILAGEEDLRTALEVPIISPFVQEFLNYLRDGTEKIIDGIVRIKDLFVDSLTVGSRERPSGITIFDEVTGEPYCLKIRNGESVVVSGECDSQEEIENQTESEANPVEVQDLTDEEENQEDEEILEEDNIQEGQITEEFLGIQEELIVQDTIEIDQEKVKTNIDEDEALDNILETVSE